MSSDSLGDQAATIAVTLPSLIRTLFTLDEDDQTRDLPVGQLRVCAILQDGPRSVSALSRELGISASATTQIADRLERAKIVERTADPEDRRIRSLQLTARGAAMMHKRRQRRIRRIRSALRTMSPGRREDVVRALQVLLDASLATVGLPIGGSLPPAK